MKPEIHPEYMECQVTCACGETFPTRSTRSELRVEICSQCHPFFSGEQRIVDAEGRVEQFIRRYGLQSRYEQEEAEDTQEGTDDTEQ